MKNKKEDKSVRVQQREKIKETLDIKPFPWTEKQQEFIKLASNKETKVIFVKGPAGSSKTLLATFIALTLLNNKNVDEILYLRAAVESSDSKIGFLPGSCEEKMSHYGVPLLEKLDELLTPGQVNKLVNDERVKVVPVGFTRGLSWSTKAILIDEAQNLTFKELVTLLTRIGKFSKCFVLADDTQSDINGKSGAFTKMCDMFDDEESRQQGVHYFELNESDILRSELCRFFVGRFSKERDSKKVN
jgi:phosphate starvation-inducible PhoH-like protein